MIKIFLLDFFGADEDAYRLSALPDFVGETKNPALRRERVFAYLLLSYAYKKCFSEDMPKIERTELSRPYFAYGAVDFNLSHDENFAALVISDEGRVGVDVEKISDNLSERLKTKVDKLYLEKSDILTSKTYEISEEVKFLKIENSRITESTFSDFYKEKLEKEVDFFEKWTFLEALSKADGGGLSSLSKVDLTKEKVGLKRKIIADRVGGRYALTVVILKGDG